MSNQPVGQRLTVRFNVIRDTVAPLFRELKQRRQRHRGRGLVKNEMMF